MHGHWFISLGQQEHTFLGSALHFIRTTWFTYQARRQDIAAGGAKNQKEAPKTGRGGKLKKYCIRCMQQLWGQTWNERAQISNGGPGTTAPPLATALSPTSLPIFSGAKVGSVCRMQLRPSDTVVSPYIMRLFKWFPYWIRLKICKIWLYDLTWKIRLFMTL